MSDRAIQTVVDQDIALAAPSAPASVLAPRDGREAFEMAKLMAASRMFGVTTPEQAFVVFALADALRIHFAVAFTKIHVINGKPALSADLQVAICKYRRDVCRYFRLVESTEERATWETHRVGEPVPTSMTFTMAEADRAGLLANPMWKRYPRNMLRKRAAAFLVRDVYPDVVGGMYDDDELRDVEADRGGRREPPPSQRVSVDVVAEQEPANDYDGADAPLLRAVARVGTSDERTCDAQAAELRSIVAKVAALRLPDRSERRATFAAAFKAAKDRLESLAERAAIQAADDAAIPQTSPADAAE